MKEIWKPVKGYEGIYEVSNLGAVKGLQRIIIRSNGRRYSFKRRIMQQSKDRDGYYRVYLVNKSIKKTRHVHQLIAEAFLGHKPCGMRLVVDHKDDDKQNNRSDNLQIMTNKANRFKGKTLTSKYDGVSLSEPNSNKWCADIRISGKKYNLGRFDSELEAHLKYQEKLQESRKGGLLK